MAVVNHQDNFGTNVTSNQIAGVTTTPLNSIPTIAAPFYIALDATNINGKYEVVSVTSKTATNILHAATTYAHTTAEEVRMVVPAVELDSFITETGTQTLTNKTMTNPVINYTDTAPNFNVKFRTHLTTASNTGNAAFAKINFNVELYDTGSDYDNATNYRFTAPVTGYYHFDARTRLMATATVGIISLYKNGVEFIDGSDLRVSMSLMALSVSSDTFLTAGDYIEVFVYGNAAIAIDNSNQMTYFSGHLFSI